MSLEPARPQRRTASPVLIEGQSVLVSSLDKLLWPEARFTKGAMIDYYVRIAPVLLPHLADRPLTLGRFPNGVTGRGFAQIECPGRPDWLATCPLVLKNGHVRHACLATNAASLAWMANAGAIELHTFLSHAEHPNVASAVAFDLDPGTGAGLLDCCAVALRLRDALELAGLRAVPKTSGASGLHVYVPLNPTEPFDRTKAFARRVAELLAERHPDRIVASMARSIRARKVFIDWSRNDPSATLAAPYSLRAVPWPRVSTPVTWDEIERALTLGRADLLTFDAPEVLARVARVGDLFRPLLDLEQRLET